MVRKLALSFTCCLCLAAAIYIGCLRSDSQTLALRALSKGQLDSAESYLERAEKLPRAQRCLLEGYLSRARGNFEQADQIFERGISLCSDADQAKASTPFAAELVLNTLFNAYLKRDWPELNRRLDRSRDLGIPQTSTALFAAIASQQRGDHPGALEQIAQALPLRFSSPWMRVAFAERLTPTWTANFRARSLLALAQTTRARQLMREAPPQKPIDRGERALLLALSYLQEGQNRPSAIAGAYYKLSDAYLQSDPQTPPEEIVAACKRSIERGDLAVCAPLIARMSSWGGASELKQLAEAIAAGWGSFANPPTAEQSQSLTGLPDAFRALLDEQLGLSVSALIGDEGCDRVNDIYTNAAALASQPQIFAKSLAGNLTADLERRIREFDNSLKSAAKLARIQERLALLGQLRALEPLSASESDPINSAFSEAIALSDDEGAAALWQQLGGWLDQPANLKSSGRSALQSWVAAQFNAALASWNFERMTRLCDLSNALKLKAIPDIDLNALSSALGDAEYYLSRGDFDQAIRRLIWILRVSPGHREGTYQLVQARLAQKNFEEALDLIETSRHLDLLDREIFCLAGLHRVERALALVNRPGAHISDKTLKLLVQKAIHAGFSEEALSVCERIAKPDDETWGLAAIAAFDARRFETCWSSYCKVNMRPTLAMTTRALGSLIELRSDREARELVAELSDNFETSDLPSELTDSALLPAALCARYYREREENWAAAARCLNAGGDRIFAKIENIRLLIDTDQPTRALELIAENRRLASWGVNCQLTALASRALVARGEQCRALAELRELLRDQVPQAARPDCVLALRALGQWQTALNVLDGAQGPGWATPRIVHQIALLGELGRREEGAQLAKRLLRGRSAALSKPFECFEILIAAGKCAGEREPLPILNRDQRAQLTPARAAMIGQYLIDIGDWEGARLLRSETPLATTLRGRCALADIALLSGDRATSLKQWTRLLCEPNLPDANFAWGVRRLAQLRAPAADLLEIWKRTGLSLGPVAEGAAFRQSAILIALLDSKSHTEELQGAARELVSSLPAIAERAPELIWPLVHLGQLQRALGDEASAQATFRTAVNRHPTSAAAHYGLAQSRELTESERIQHLDLAAAAAPERADFRTAIAELHLTRFRSTRNTAEAQLSRAQFNRANLLDPQLPGPYWGMAELADLEGRTKQAKRLLQAGLARLPEELRASFQRELAPRFGRDVQLSLAANA